MTLDDLQAWAQAQIDNTAEPEVRPDIGISVLQLVDEVEQLNQSIKELELKLAAVTRLPSPVVPSPQPN